jgi:hypothetical protein
VSHEFDVVGMPQIRHGEVELIPAGAEITDALQRELWNSSASLQLFQLRHFLSLPTTRQFSLSVFDDVCCDVLFAHNALDVLVLIGRIRIQRASKRIVEAADNHKNVVDFVRVIVNVVFVSQKLPLFQVSEEPFYHVSHFRG